MKKKSIFLAAILMLICTLTTTKAALAGSITLNGSIRSNCGELVFTNFNISGLEVDNFKGQITYDKNVLAIYSIEVNSTFEEAYKYTMDTKTLGTIKFDFSYNGTEADKAKYLISGDTNPFTITFIVIGTNKTTTSIATKNCSSTITNIFQEEVEDKTIILNQSDIDAANKHNSENPENQITVPSAIYGKKFEDVEKVEAVNYSESKQQVSIDKIISNDSYLKDLSITNGTLSPNFSRGNSAYKCTIDSKEEIKINYVVSDPKSTVTIGEEMNNQITITVKAEDGTSNIYVVTIIRQDNYSPSTKPNTPVNPSTPSTPSTPNVNDAVGLSTITILASAALVVFALIGFTVGGILIYKGAHNQ